MQDSGNANYYYETTGTSRTQIVYDENGNVIPVYWQDMAEYIDDDYDSLRIEGEDGIAGEDGNTYYYVYARSMSGNNYECRVNYYEYYIFYHSYWLKTASPNPISCSARRGRDRIFSPVLRRARSSPSCSPSAWRL